MNKLKLITLQTIIIAIITVICGCSGDDNPINPPTGGKPNIQFKLGSRFTFTFDTLSRVNGTAVRLTNVTSRDTINLSFPIGVNTAYRIVSRTDSASVISYDTALVYYDSAAGKLYQYGVTRIFNPNATPNWDLVGDFSLAYGTSWNLQLNPDSILINGFYIKVNINAKVIGATSFQSTGSPSVNVPCYQIEFKGDLSYQGLPIGSIYFDYFVGYNTGTVNSSGIVRLRLRPVNIGIPPIVISNYGVDKMTATFNVP